VVNVEDDKAKQLAAFVENVKKADSVREQYPGSFIAVCGQRVIAHNAEYKHLLNSINEYLDKKDLYIGYLPKAGEVLLV